MNKLLIIALLLNITSLIANPLPKPAPLALSSSIDSERIFIGELQENWNFPSDHLPIGIFLEDANHQFQVISWNVLNSAYMKWIYENSQGLARSELTKNDFVIKDNGLTLREQLVINSLLKMLALPSPLICLQECSELFIQELVSQLPPHIKIIRSSEAAVKNQNIALYDANLFKFVEKTLHSNVFSLEPNRPLMEFILEKQGIRFRIFNAHLRCDPSNPQCFDLAAFVYKQKQKEEIAIVLGDLNVDQSLMIEAFVKSAAQSNLESTFLPFSPYKTTVSPELESKSIDHIFLDFGMHLLTVRAAAPDELLEELQQKVDLLSNKEFVNIHF